MLTWLAHLEEKLEQRPVERRCLDGEPRGCSRRKRWRYSEADDDTDNS